MSLISKQGNPTSVESTLRIVFAVVVTLSTLTLHICMHYNFVQRSEHQYHINEHDINQALDLVYTYSERSK